MSDDPSLDVFEELLPAVGAVMHYVDVLTLFFIELIFSILDEVNAAQRLI